MPSIYSRLAAVLIWTFPNHLFWAQFCLFLLGIPSRPFIWMTVCATKGELPQALKRGAVYPTSWWLFRQLKHWKCDCLAVSELYFSFPWPLHVTGRIWCLSERTLHCRKDNGFVLQRKIRGARMVWWSWVTAETSQSWAGSSAHRKTGAKSGCWSKSLRKDLTSGCAAALSE